MNKAKRKRYSPGKLKKMNAGCDKMIIHAWIMGADQPPCIQK